MAWIAAAPNRQVSPFRSDRHAFAAVTGLPSHLQNIIGRIVWWDFFAGTLVANRTTLFDCWLNPPRDEVDPPADECIAALIAIGYTPYRANIRFAQKSI
jgi:hypothetical protein